MLKTIFIVLFVSLIMYSVYAFATGLTPDDIRAGFIFTKPKPVTEERKCVYGPWLPCDNGIHKRHEILAESAADETNVFTCGQPAEEKPCATNRMCTMDLIPVCACTEYDINNTCVKNKRYSNRCDANMFGEPLPIDECAVNNSE